MALTLFPGDSALLLAILVIGAWALLGMSTDGLRMGMLFISSIIAWLLAPLLGNWMPAFLLPSNPIWHDLGIGAVPAFGFLTIIFSISVHFLHKKVTLDLKYKWDTPKHEKWEKLNATLGLTCGGMLGIWYYVLICGVILPFGYLIAKVQPTHPANDPLGYRLCGRLYRDLSSLGLNRTSRLFDPAPADYYPAADIAALTYNNFSTNNLEHINRFRSRLLGYPGLVDAAYNRHVMALMHVWTTNTFFMGLYTRTNLTYLLNHQELSAAWKDDALKAQLTQVDFRDLRQFLESGKSRQYNIAILQQQGRPPILGRWELDPDNTLQQFKSQYPKMNEREEQRLLEYLSSIGKHLSLSFSDGYCYLEGRTFPKRALGVRVAQNSTHATTNDFIPSLPPRNVSDYSQLITYGSWEARPSGIFHTKFVLGKATSPVSIQLYPSTLMITLESLRNEKYVFRRQEL